MPSAAFAGVLIAPLTLTGDQPIDVEFTVQYLVLAHSGARPELQQDAGNIALLQRAEAAGLLPPGVGQAAAVAYREMRRAQHRARLDEASTTRDLADSQLFGHRRGSFTGAVTDQPGLIRSAAGGTLEVADAALHFDGRERHLRALVFLRVRARRRAPASRQGGARTQPCAEIPVSAGNPVLGLAGGTARHAGRMVASHRKSMLYASD